MTEPSHCLLLSDRVVDLVRGEVRLLGAASPLTSRELALLSYLARTPEQVVPRDTLLAEVWGHRGASQTRAVDLAVLRLRTKLEVEPRQPRHLLTVFGEGYRLSGVQRARPPGNLPLELDRGVGLDGMLDTLERALDDHRAIALVGPFGIGKSRIASALGRRVEARFRGGVWWCDAQACRDVADLPDVVGRALHIPAEQVEAGLAARPPTLLLVDGLDALPAEVDALLTGWLQRAPALTLVVTARRPVALPGARLVEVAPLAEAAALALLLDRAAAAGQVVSPEAGRRLVARLDGHPLAIELAAAQTRLYAPEAPLQRLNAAVYPGLAGLVRDAYDALDPREQRVLGVCASFAGGFTADAVELVAQRSDPPTALQALRERSLLSRAEDPHRLRLLDCVREHVVAREIAAGRWEDVVAAHGRWAAATGLELAEAIGRTGRPAAWARLSAERANLLDAWRRADGATRRRLVLGLGPLLAELPNAADMLEDALSDTGASERGALLALRGRTRRIRGRLDEAAVDLSDAQALLPADSLDGRVCRFTLGLVAIDRGRPEDALVQLDALACAEPPDAIAGAAAAQRGRALRSLGRLPAARAATIEGLDILRAVGARRLEATALAVLSDLFDGDPERATRMIVYQEEALGIHREEGNLRGEAVTLSNLVNTLADLERWAEVWTTAEQARAAHEALGARRSEGILLANLAGIAFSCFDLDRAEAYGTRAARICAATGVRYYEGLAWLNLGMGALARDAAADAEHRFTTARALFAGNLLMEVMAEGALAAAEATLGRIDAAAARLARFDADTLAGRPVLRAAFSLYGGFVDVARARAGDAEVHRAAARARIAALFKEDAGGRSLPPELATTEVRGMVRLLERVIGADLPS